MKQYWANALASTKNGEPFQLFTYDSAKSMEDALKCIEGWCVNYGYTVYCAWVDDGYGNILYFRCYTDAVGIVRNPYKKEESE